jgi:hypothetical protein
MALTKFSAATTSHGYPGPIPWSHVISENGLFAMFEFPSSQSISQTRESARFKIVNDPDVLVKYSRAIEDVTHFGRKISISMHLVRRRGGQLRRLLLEA